MSKRKEYEDYLAAKHASFGVSIDTVSGAVKEATGQNITNLHRVIAGEINEVYEVNTENGDYFMRISRHGKTDYSGERWALDMALANGVVAPKMIDMGEISDEGTILKYCIEERVPGESMSSLMDEGRLTQSQIDTIGYEAGVVLAKLHEIRTQGFGKISKDGKGTYQNWSEYVLKYVNRNNQDLYENATKCGIAIHEIKLAIDILKQFQSLYDTVTPRLIHCDYRPKHFMVSEGKLSGVIDFGSCMSGDPVCDFAWEIYHHNRDWIKKGYLSVAYVPSDFDLRVNLYQLRINMDLIRFYAIENHLMGMVHAKNKMNECLDYFIKRYKTD